MRKNKEYFNFLLIGFCALIVSYFAVLIPSKFSLSVNDLPPQFIYYNKNLRSAFKKSFKPLKIIAVGIDNYTLEKISYRFPFPRSIYGEVVKNLSQEKVNTIGFDLVFEGASSDSQEDAAFFEALKNSSPAKVVLAFMLGSGMGKELYILPQPRFRQSIYALGLVDNQKDLDQKNRRLNVFMPSESNDQLRYSFFVQLAASYLNKPASEVAGQIPIFKKDILPVGLANIEIKNFFLNYIVDLQDKDLVTRISFYDLYANMEGLKKKFGRDFLRDSLVLIYPEAEILHDTVITPLGKFPGGFLHINGLFNIISGKFMFGTPWLTFFFLIVTLAAIFLSLRYTGLFSGLFLVCGVWLITFWAAIALWFKGFALNLAQVILFSILFFVAGSIYKYVLALLRLERIKNKVALDPLSNLYILHYFYYYFDLAARKHYLGKELYLFFIYLESFKAEIQNMPMNNIRNVWRNIQAIVQSKDGFWAAYSAEEIVGGIFYSPKNAGKLAQAFKNALQSMFKERGLNVMVKIGYFKVKKEYSPRELLFIFSSELKKRASEVIFFNALDFLNALKSQMVLKQDENEFLQSIDADIEEKNRKLLEMVENLSKEQVKNQEMFFQVILSLVNALEARDPYSEGHSQRVASYALKFAQKLGWNKIEMEKLRKASLLHDLGKIGIPDSILHKKSQLSDEEFDFIKKHEIIAVKILEPIKEVADILPWILYHHERWDGKGYPHGLGGNSIPLASQIISLADVYDALTTGRDYKKAMIWEDSLAEIEKNKNAQFNPELVDVFTQVIRELHA